TRHLLSGLEACHRNGLLHRDVKPGNLLLASMDTAQLGDFGLIERLVGGVAPTNGTLAFQPPEALATGVMTPQADVYAAGLTLWMILTGSHPFLDPATPPADIPPLINAGIPRLRDIVPHVPSSLATVVERACSTDPAARYGTAQMMNEALGALPKFARLWTE